MAGGSAAGGGGLGTLRPLRHALLTATVVLAVCGVLAGVAATTFAAASAHIDAATGRAEGVVDAVRDESAVVRWTPPGGAERVDTVEVAGTPPAPDARTEVAFDPADAADPLIPGARILADADRALTTLAFSLVVALLVVGVLAWQVFTRRRAFAQPVRSVPVRRVRWQAGLVTRSYLETESHPQRWIPVHFDPVLVGLPSPTVVRLHGDPLRDRLVAATVPGPDGEHPLVPSGAVRLEEPRGERTDNPSRPDRSVGVRAAALARMTRQLQADLPLLVPAPFIGLLWTYVDRGGLPTWVAVTALAASLGLWLGAVRGSDPT